MSARHILNFDTSHTTTVLPGCPSRPFRYHNLLTPCSTIPAHVPSPPPPFAPQPLVVGVCYFPPISPIRPILQLDPLRILTRITSKLAENCSCISASPVTQLISIHTNALSGNQDLSVSPSRALPSHTSHISSIVENDDDSYTAPPPLLPSSASSSAPASPSSFPPPFSSLYFIPNEDQLGHIQASVTESPMACLPAFAPALPFEELFASSSPSQSPAQPPVILDTKAALSRDKTGESSVKGIDDGEPPLSYTERLSPLESFTYVMAAAGGAASIITQVQQTGGGPLNTLGDIGGDEHITLDLCGTQFMLSCDKLLTLPEFVLLCLFPNGLLPDGHMGTFHEADVYPVDEHQVALEFANKKGRTLRIFGSPYTPQFGNFAFQYERKNDYWADRIPDDIDIVVTHGPPLCQLDTNPFGAAVGCAHLRRELSRKSPKLVDCGHIHEGHGEEVLLWDELQAEWERVVMGESSSSWYRMGFLVRNGFTSSLRGDIEDLKFATRIVNAAIARDSPKDDSHGLIVVLS
ncbi:hypothetical protein AJ79_08425 [Helicocarpus griseus UAMH5409]|uniref:Calcineurin-like phosphoesterase domain-containing protein n=1 Tax=Helicocarpus griseus UAMH5409 TaxID=1447875 RepID=A0A2B7WT32_9EURO|nr:hypothetical protein AJ79_08425 [Helicocarpus griseus UAMH5409]